MKRLLLLAATVLLGFSAAHAAEKLKVVTTTTDLADIAGRIAGDRATVEALSLGFQNPHFVDAKPSLIVKLMKANAFIETGLELESGWAPLLVRGARNKDILPGAKGHIDASAAITPIEVPTNPSRAEGDVHPGGNPHYLADPVNAGPVAKLIAERLTRLDPDGAAVYGANLAAFTKELDARVAEWTATMAPHKGAPFVSYHRDWSYFAKRFGLESVGEIEPKPGIPPSAPHTAEIIRIMKSRNVKIILLDPWFEDRTANSIAKETGAKVLKLALFPGGDKNATTYLDTVGNNVKAVAEALK